MKQALLLFFFFLFFTPTQAQSSTDRNWYSPFEQEAKEQIQVFPNPAVSHISLTSSEGVSRVVVYNLVGRKLKVFADVVADKKYFIGDLSKGIYLVQIMDEKNAIITTRRVSKK